jgi:hypothetical protein
MDAAEGSGSAVSAPAVICALAMRTESPRIRILHLVRQAARRRPRNNRQIWLIVSSLVIAVCAGAMVIPAKRDGLACAVTGLIGMGLR